ncbi:MAG: transporter substrate-binding domain-containing protein, partial [Caldiserica bacterium]|nr:transporter substrate-binding domain-containing protein [Caldisericota bacterium]
MKKTAFARSVVLVVVALMMVTVLTGCKTQTGTLNWGTDPTYAPFEYADEANKPTGFDVELMEAIAAKMGKTSSLTSGAFDGLLLALQGKKFDAVCAAMTITPEREQEVSFSIPYYRADMGIMYNPAKNNITKPEDLVGKTVGVQTGTTGETSAKLIAGVKVNSYPDIQLATLDLENGKTDAVVNDY